MKKRRIIHIDGADPADLEWEEGERGAYTFGFQSARQRSASVMAVEPGVYSVLIEGRSYEVKIAGNAVALEGRRYLIGVIDPRTLASRSGAQAAGTGKQAIRAPMPGKVIRVLAGEGEQVEAGQGLAVVEAMKMQNELKAPRAGRIVSLRVRQGDTVASGDMLAEIE